MTFEPIGYYYQGAAVLLGLTCYLAMRQVVRIRFSRVSKKVRAANPGTEEMDRLLTEMNAALKELQSRPETVIRQFVPAQSRSRHFREEVRRLTDVNLSPAQIAGQLQMPEAEVVLLVAVNQLCQAQAAPAGPVKKIAGRVNLALQ